MKTEAIEVTTVVEDILCDICGSTVIPSGLRKYVNDIDSSSTYGKLTASFGFDSTCDGEKFHFDFCEPCYNKVLSHVTKLQSL